MKNPPIPLKTVLRVLCVTVTALLVLLSLAACAEEGDVTENIELSQAFMTCVVTDDLDGAYALVKETVTSEDFTEYWQEIRASAEGTTDYTLELTSSEVRTSRGLTTRTAEFTVTTDTGRTVYLKTVTRDDYGGIAGIQFTDVTELLESSAGFLPTVRVILYILSGLCILFVVLAFVDCLRRNMKYKVVWALIVLFSVGLALTLGNSPSLSFDMGLFLEPSTVQAVLSRNAVVTVLNIPVGAILYVCLRKRLLAEPAKTD